MSLFWEKKSVPSWTVWGRCSLRMYLLALMFRRWTIPRWTAMQFALKILARLVNSLPDSCELLIPSRLALFLGIN
jgi:hypothetical protein